MAAYAAVISLRHTITGLWISSSPTSSRREILESAYNEASSLQQVLEGLNESSRSKSSMERVDALEGQIRDCANKLEDFLEIHELNHKIWEDEEREELRKEISTFGERAKKMKEEYIEELSRDDEDDDDSSIDVVSDLGVEMVGHSTEFTKFRENLVDKMRSDDLCYYSFCGEMGSGRTKVPRTVYEDLSKCRGEYFDCWAWVTVKHHELKQVLLSIISQVVVDGDDDDESLMSLSEDELSEYLVKGLENRMTSF